MGKSRTSTLWMAWVLLSCPCWLAFEWVACRSSGPLCILNPDWTAGWQSQSQMGRNPGSFQDRVIFLKIDFLERWRVGKRERQRDRQRQKLLLVVPLTDTFIDIDWFLYMPWPETEQTTSVCRNDAVTNWATQPGLRPGYFLTVQKKGHIVHATITTTTTISCLLSLTLGNFIIKVIFRQYRDVLLCDVWNIFNMVPQSLRVINEVKW